MRQIYLRYVLVVSLFASIFSACKKNNYPIPNVPVNITINLDLPSYQPLIYPGGVAYVNGGARGIIVYRNFEEFVALDRNSTYNSDDECAIVDVDPDNQFQLVDTCSGSKFSIMNGGVVEGPAKYGLKRYNAYWDGASSVHIYN